MLFTEILPYILKYDLVSRKRFGGQRSIKMTRGKIQVYWLNDKNKVCKSHWLPNRIDLIADDWFIIK